ncbi:MAG: hypothetical protein OYH77_07680 [Pseudomonadota bacterium]|nr:hypothetical protein [Pseudomonadota bacterium]
MRMLLVLFLISCAADDQHADVSWLIDQQHERVMGLISKKQQAAKLYILLECRTYDSIVAASEAYAAGRTALPNDCRKLIEQELTASDLPSEAGETTRDQLLKKISSAAGITTLLLGISERYANFLVDAAGALREADVLPKLVKGSHTKRAGIILLAGIILTKSVALWQREGSDARSAFDAELKGAKYQNSMQDIELTPAEYQKAQQMLIEALGLPPVFKTTTTPRPLAN